MEHEQLILFSYLAQVSSECCCVALVYVMRHTNQTEAEFLGILLTYFSYIEIILIFA